MTARRTLLTALIGLTLSTGVAEAHIYLAAPAPRYMYAGGQLVQGPCATPTALSGMPATHMQVGVAFNVRWTEMIVHPGHFRIAMAPTDAGLPTPPTMTPAAAAGPILADGLFQHVQAGTAPNTVRMQSITPTTAGMYTLQVAQTVDGSTTVYYSCADVVVDPAGGGTGGAPGTGGVTGTGGAGAGTGGRAGMGGVTGSGGVAAGSGGAVGTGGTALGSGGVTGTGGATTGSGGATGTGTGGSAAGTGGATGTGGAATGATDANSSGGCAYAGHTTRLGLIAPFAFAGVFAALSLRRRRARNKSGRA